MQVESRDNSELPITAEPQPVVHGRRLLDLVSDQAPALGRPPSPKEGIKAIFSLGNYDEIALNLEEAAGRLVDSCCLSPGARVLDVAAGTGNAAIRAARRGARVTACDLTPAMVEAGKRRCQREGVDVGWIQADAERLPFVDGGFDCATMVFGPFMAEGSQAIASEMFRVVRRGGVVAVVSWTPDGFASKFGMLLARYLGGAGASLQEPQKAANPDAFRGIFGPLASEVEFGEGAVHNRYHSFDDFLAFFQTNMGAFVAAKRKLSIERYSAMVGALRRLTDLFNTSPNGGLWIDSEYQIAFARRK